VTFKVEGAILYNKCFERVLILIITCFVKWSENPGFLITNEDETKYIADFALAIAVMTSLTPNSKRGKKPVAFIIHRLSCLL
jgi:hypothetical protein